MADESLILKKAYSQIEWSKAHRLLREGLEEETLKSLIQGVQRSEKAKEERNFTLGKPSDKSPMVGCNEICSVNGFMGGVEGPLDYCRERKTPAGNLFFCSSPEAGRLSDGSWPLCVGYSSKCNFDQGVRAVARGKIRIKE